MYHILSYSSAFSVLYFLLTKKKQIINVIYRLSLSIPAFAYRH
jgi:hypothetical protein